LDRIGFVQVSEGMDHSSGMSYFQNQMCRVGGIVSPSMKGDVMSLVPGGISLSGIYLMIVRILVVNGLLQWYELFAESDST